MIHRKSSAVALLLATAICGLGVLLADCRSEHRDHGSKPGHGHASGPADVVLPANVNAVQNEMRVLNEAARDWVTAIANNSLPSVPASIERIHTARAVTEKALEDGTYKPPKNSDDVAGFQKQDEAFHAELVKLLNQAAQNDLAATTKQLGVVLEGCTDCHKKYRF